MLTRSFAPALVLGLLLGLLSPRGAAAQGFNAVTTQDGIDVWAVGDAGAVYRSLDGGAVWASVPMGSAGHNGVAAKGSGVWVVDDGGALWASTDGGASFSTQTLAGGADLEAVCFVNGSSGWIAGAGGTILKTKDGGANWSAQVSGTSATLRAVRFASPTEGWAVGGGGTVVHTTNGGTSWAVTTPFPSFTRDLYDIDFDGATIYAVGTYGFLGKSTDGGGSWSTPNLWIYSRSDVNGIEVLPGGTFWLCGGGGFLRKSVDGGESFTYPIHPVVTGLTDIIFSDATHGWACTATSRNVARTSDGGATWTIPGGGAFTYSWSQKISSGGGSIRGDTFYIDRNNRDKVWAVQGLTVYASWNRGDSWTAVGTIGGGGSRTNSFYVSPTDTMTWVAAVQDADRVARTTNGGATWTAAISIPMSEYGMPLEQDPNQPNTLYYAPEDGTIRKSTDFGATWSLVSTPGFSSPCDVVVVPDTSGIMYLGDTGGIVWRSTDSGVSWSLRLNVGSSEIPTIGVSALDNRVAYATSWGSGGVHRTLDVGVTWPSVSPAGSAWGCDVAKDDPYVGMFSVYSGSTTYLTTNNGASFQTSPITGSNYGVLMYDRGTFLTHQSGGIWKATVNQPGMPVNNAQLVTLISPNGGEVWQYNDARSITWSSQNLVSVKIEYRTSPAGPWQLIAASTPGPSGSYPWVIPNDPTTQARVRVSDTGDGAPIDESNADFSIVVPAIASNRASIDFGVVSTAAPKTDTLRIVNAGTGVLVISSIAAAGGQGSPFAPNRTSMSIPAGSSDTLEVTFSPPAEQAYQDTLVIQSNAPTAILSIPLAGIGGSPVAVASSGTLSARFELRENVPNPFGDRGTTISYSIPAEMQVSLVVYNAVGQIVATLVQGRQVAGPHAVRFPEGDGDGSGVSSRTLSSGVYFYRLTAGDRVETRRMVFLR